MDGIGIGRRRPGRGFGCEIGKACHAEPGDALPVRAGSEMSRSPRTWKGAEQRPVSCPGKSQGKFIPSETTLIVPPICLCVDRWSPNAPACWVHLGNLKENTDIWVSPPLSRPAPVCFISPGCDLDIRSFTVSPSEHGTQRRP